MLLNVAEGNLAPRLRRWSLGPPCFVHTSLFRAHWDKVLRVGSFFIVSFYIHVSQDCFSSFLLFAKYSSAASFSTPLSSCAPCMNSYCPLLLTLPHVILLHCVLVYRLQREQSMIAVYSSKSSTSTPLLLLSTAFSPVRLTKRRTKLFFKGVAENIESNLCCARSPFENILQIIHTYPPYTVLSDTRRLHSPHHHVVIEWVPCDVLIRTCLRLQPHQQ